MHHPLQVPWWPAPAHFLSLLALFCAAFIASSMMLWALLANPVIVSPSGDCAIFCEQPWFYCTSSVMSMSSSSLLSPASSSMDWAMLTSLSLPLSRILSWVSPHSLHRLGLGRGPFLSVVPGMQLRPDLPRISFAMLSIAPPWPP